MSRSTHIAAPATRVTYCGRRTDTVRCIGRSEVVDSATCKVCQRVDDYRQVRDYAAECRAAGVDPATGEKVK